MRDNKKEKSVKVNKRNLYKENLKGKIKIKIKSLFYLHNCQLFPGVYNIDMFCHQNEALLQLKKKVNLIEVFQR